MHYKNGREAKNGDKVIHFRSWGPPIIGILYNATPGYDTCNGNLALVTANDPCPCLNGCLHADDVAAAVGKDTADTSKPAEAAPAEETPVS